MKKYLSTNRGSVPSAYKLNGETHNFMANYGTFSLPEGAELETTTGIIEFEELGYTPPAQPTPVQEDVQLAVLPTDTASRPSPDNGNTAVVNKATNKALDVSNNSAAVDKQGNK